MGYVYFLKHEGMQPVKIGMTNSKDISKRVSSYTTSSPYGIKLLGSIETDDAKKLESELHKKFKKQRLKGEWFDLTDKEVEYIISKNRKGLSENERVYLDIPFEFNWRQYYLNELKLFRCFFEYLTQEKTEFKYSKISRIVRKHAGIPEIDINYNNLRNSFDEYYLLMGEDKNYNND